MYTQLAKSRSTILAAACTLMLGASLVLAEPGELFPNVAPYDQTVSSPISKPDVKTPPAPVNPDPTPPAPPAPVDPNPPAPPAPNPNPADNPNNNNPPAPTDPVKPPPRRRRPPKPLPETQPATQPLAPPLVEFAPYAKLLMKPIIGPDDAKTFDDSVADSITKALAGTPDQRKKIADFLESSATGVASSDLKRYLMLHAFGLYIRAAIPAADREQKALALLPLLTDKTLPVMQARADALNDLSMTFSTAPSNAFLDLYIDAHAQLTKYRVQTGFPKEALESLKKARESGIHYINKPKTRIDEINEAAAWCDRANLAAALAPKYQESLKSNPNDPAANTIMATLHISLYGNLDAAAPFAAKSDRKDMKQLAAVLKDNPPDSLATDPVKHAEQILAIGQALVDVAKATSTAQIFDRYSIACFAGDHVAQVIDDGAMPPAKLLEAKTLLVTAKDIVDKTFLRRGDDLPKWLGGTGAGVANPTAPPKRTIAAVGDFFRGIPKELAPGETGWTPNQMQLVNDWFAKNVEGQNFDAQVFIEHLDSPQDGPGGKVVVPVTFQFQNVQLKDNLTAKTFIEVQATPEMAKRAKEMSFEQQVEVKGTIESVTLRSYYHFPNEAIVVGLKVVVKPN